MSLKYLCKMECFLFWPSLFWNSCCGPWNSTFVWFHSLTLTTNSDPNNCPKLWPVNLWACEKAKKKKKGGIQRWNVVLFLSRGRYKPVLSGNLCDPEMHRVTVCATGPSKSHLSLFPVLPPPSFYEVFFPFLFIVFLILLPFGLSKSTLPPPTHPRHLRSNLHAPPLLSLSVWRGNGGH